MNFENIINVFNPYLTSSLIKYAVRPTTIWTLRSDSTLFVFKRSNLKTFSKFPFDGPDPSLAKISVDALGEKCVIFWDRPPILFFSLATGEFSIIQDIKTSFYPSAACWMPTTNGSSDILFGSITGEILSISSDENHEVKSLYTMPNGQLIRELHSHVNGDMKMIFVNIEEQILTFYGTSDIEQIFQKGPSNKVIVLFGTEQQNPNSKRIILDTYEGSIRLSVLHMLGVMSYVAQMDGNRLINYDQKVSEFDITNVVAIETCQWGFLVVFDKNILFFYESKPKASLPISNVRHISCDNIGLVLFTDEEIITISTKSFLHYIVHDAVKHKLFDYALYLSQNDSIRFYVLKKQIEKMFPEKVGKYLISLKWSINDIVKAVGLDSTATLAYLTEYIVNLPKTMKKQRFAMINWAFQLHSKFYPQMEQQFIKFLQDYGQEMPKEEIYHVLDEINFQNGIIEFAKVINDEQKIINQIIAYKDINDVLNYLASINNSKLISLTLQRLIETRKKEVIDFLNNNYLKIVTEDQLPLVSFVPETASQIFNEFTTDKTARTMMMISMCMNHLDDRIIQLLSRSKTDFPFLYRFSNYFECHQAVSRILIRLHKSKQAVRVALKFGSSSVHNFLASIKDTETQKDAWTEYVNNIKGEERDRAINRLIATNLFTFEELIDVIGDDSFLYEYADEMLQAVKKMEKDAETIYYRTHFHQVRAPDFPISYAETCRFCSLPLLGTKFVAFPCGHVMHKECLHKMVDEVRKHHPDDEIGDMESCPICGIISVETVLQPF